MNIFCIALLLLPINLLASQDSWNNWHDEQPAVCEEPDYELFAENIARNSAAHSKRSLACNLALGVATASSLYWGHKKFTTHHTSAPENGRFGTLGLAALPLLKDMAGPVVSLLAGGYLLYQAKQSIIYPYLVKQEEEIDKFKKALDEHRKQTHEQYERFVKETQDTIAPLHDHIQSAHGDIEQIKKQLDATSTELEHTQQTNKDIKAIIDKAMPAFARTNELVSKLSQQVEKEAKMMHRYASLRKRSHGSIPKKGTKPRKGLWAGLFQ